MRKLMRYVGIGLACGAIIALIVVYILIPKHSVVIFDNGTESPIIVCTVAEEAQPVKKELVQPKATPPPLIKRGCNLVLGSVAPHNVLRTDRLWPGKHKVRFMSEDPQLQAIFDIDVPQNALRLQRRFIYNIRKGNHYAIYKIGYGDSDLTRPAIKHLQDRTFFEITTRFDLGQGFPETVRVMKKLSGTTVTVLGHHPLHWHYACCYRLRTSLEHLPEYRFEGSPSRPAPLIPIPPRPAAAPRQH